MKLSQIPTPALCVDVEILQRNIERMASFFRGRDCALRPHFKAHKTPAIARLQAEAGFGGFTCATLSEAEVLVRHGFADILIANEIVDPAKLDRLRTIAERGLVTVAVDSLDAIAMLEHIPVQAVVDVNVGMPRCGVRPDGALEIGRAVTATEMHLRGVMGYEGHATLIEDPAKRGEVARASMDVLLGVVDEFRGDGLECSVVSAGSTVTYDVTGTIPGVTEVQAGSYVLMDAAFARYGVPFDEALGCLTTVLSVGEDIAVLDAGLKALAVDHGNPELHEGAPASVMFLSDEHATLAVLDGFAERPGDRVWLRPSHVDPTMNLHDHVYAISGDDVLDVWAVEGRGYPPA